MAVDGEWAMLAALNRSDRQVAFFGQFRIKFDSYPIGQTVSI